MSENKLTVLFVTARNTIYSGPVRSIALRFADGTLDVLPPRRLYFTSFKNCEIILRTPQGTIRLKVSSGTANLKKNVLTIVAELKNELFGKAALNLKKSSASRLRPSKLE